MNKFLHKNPFPGIRSFEPEEDYLFFGRETEITQVISKLLDTHFLVITGASGSGKSSFVRAGIIPSLFKNKVIAREQAWSLSIFRPGSTPIQNLAEAIFNSFKSEAAIAPEIDSADKIKAMLMGSPDGLSKVVERQNEISMLNRLIIIDQFEELFRYKHEADEADSKREPAEFVEKFLSVVNARSLPVYIVLTMRSDFLGDCTEYAGLPDAINEGHYLIPRMTDEEKKSAIAGPVKVSGGSITSSLIERLLKDVGDDPYQLPVMQHAMMRTWNYWITHDPENRAIDVNDYEAIGTMSQAISQHAEQIYNELTNERNKFLTEKLFKALTFCGTDNDARGTRRPTALKEICAIAEASEEEMIEVIDNFRAMGCAFLMPNYHIPLDSGSLIDISHESIMRKWDRLKEWVDDEMKSAERYLRLSKSAELYQEGKARLLVNPELQLTLSWQQQNKPNEVWAARYDPAFERAIQFLEYSKKEFELAAARRENRQKRELQRAKRFAIILGAASLVSLLFLMVSLNLTFKAEASEKKAVEKGKIAQQESKIAEQQRNEALAQKKISEQQQQIAEQQKIITEEQKQYALDQQKIAFEQRQEAILQKQQADKAKVEAIKSRDEAELQRKDAVKQKQIADAERVKAENSEKNTMRLRLLDIARSMAIQSVKIKSSAQDELPMLLALQAYSFNRRNKGAENNPDIFNSLSAFAGGKQVLRAHQDEVRAIAVSPGGSLMASVSDDGQIRLWDLQNKNYPSRILNSGISATKGLRSVCFSADGNYLAAGSFDGKIAIWNLKKENTLPRILTGHTFVINSLSFSKNGEIIASASSDGTLRIWELGKTVPESRIIEKSASRLNCLAFNKTGDKLVLGSEDGSIKIFNPAELKAQPVIVVPGGKAVRSICFNEQGNSLAAGFSNGIVKLFSINGTSQKAVELVGHNSSVNSVCFSPDGNLLASCCSDKTIRIWNYRRTDELPVILEDNDSWVYSVKFAPGGSSIISAGADKTIRVWNIKAEELADKIKQKIHRNMSQDEWNKYVGADIPYEKTVAALLVN